MKNNEIINHPDYYRLPCGRDLEAFIWHYDLNFAEGSALKYLWRAGKKHGEAHDKDMQKCMHYCRFLAERKMATAEVQFKQIEHLRDAAKLWDGVFG